MFEPIHIQGLNEFVRALKKVDAELPKAVRVANNKAAQLLADDARPHIPRRTGRAQRSLKARSTRSAARIVAGGKTAPYFAWLDFGGRVGRNRSIRRPFIKDGRYLYASYYRLRDSGRLVEVLQQALLGVAADAGVEVD